MHLGLPDLGFMDLSQVADHVMAIRCVIDLPLIVDIDTGFGNAINVTHTVRILVGRDNQGETPAAIRTARRVFPRGQTFVWRSEWLGSACDSSS
jgi:hypothetical protein